VSRSWSIRTRTAAAFAAASMALTTAVLVFVNLASQSSFAHTFKVDGADEGMTPSGVTDVRPVPTDSFAPSTGTSPPPEATVALITQVSALQWQWSVVGVVAAGLLAGLVGWYVSWRMLRPIDRITDTATRISASNLHERIGLSGPDDELRRLSGTIDALLERLETSFNSQRRFVAQASHELRTPLAVQRAAIQIGLPDDASATEIAEARQQLLEHNRQTEHLVESLLVLAEVERGLDQRREVLDLLTLASQATAKAMDAARVAGVTLTYETGTLLAGEVTGDSTLVWQLLVNLIDNAIEYNHQGGFVRVCVENDGIVVENSGAVVPNDVVEELVEPFRRHGGGGSRRHSGLGLSIVAAIARAHGWNFIITTRTAGGLVARVDVRSG